MSVAAPHDSASEIDVAVDKLRGLRALAQRRYPGPAPALPSREATIAFVDDGVAAIYPRHFGPQGLSAQALDVFVANSLRSAQQSLRAQARLELALTPEGGDADARADAIARLFITQAPNLRALADTDAHATVDRDVSVTSFDEVVFSHPGFAAVLRHRLAHRLHSLELPLLARIVAEDARARTGIYIHPGARIGERFVIRYGAGVVIGETAVIGRNVSLYQAVTLGAKSFDIDDALAPSREPRPRDPIVEDDVVIYAGATVLGRVTIGKGASIGGNVWLTDSVGPGSRIAQAKARNGSIA